MSTKSDLGLIGLAVMGQNLVLNMNDHGYSVSVHNRTFEKTSDFLKGPALGTKIRGYEDLESFVTSIQRPRKIMLLVKAGQVVDIYIDKLLSLLEKGDIIIDGGNSNFEDTERRSGFLKEKGILFVGSGVSGGEEGARKGPSLMPGGHSEAWESIKDIFQNISAHTDSGEACCDWVGADGAGHYVKMVHNGIEYGDMQLISEAYHLMKDVAGMSAAEMSVVFKEWNKTELDSYLIEITCQILDFQEEGKPLVDVILDSAGQKGTGKWTGIDSLSRGVPVTLIAESVYARFISSLVDERKQASQVFSSPDCFYIDDKEAFIENIRQALLASKIISYTQGFMLIRKASQERGWNIDKGNVALMWRGGCIIRSAFLDNIKEAFDRKPDLPALILDEYFAGILKESQSSWRKIVSQAALSGIPVPAFSTALSFFDAYRSERLPASLIQAQRDYFGAHTYERIDRKRGEFFHTDWTGEGGNVSSGTYNA